MGKAHVFQLHHPLHHDARLGQAAGLQIQLGQIVLQKDRSAALPDGQETRALQAFHSRPEGGPADIELLHQHLFRRDLFLDIEPPLGHEKQHFFDDLVNQRRLFDGEILNYPGRRRIQRHTLLTIFTCYVQIYYILSYNITKRQTICHFFVQNRREFLFCAL